MVDELCANCGHARSTHEQIGGYKPYGECNFQHDLCGCKKFVPKDDTVKGVPVSEAPTEVVWPTPHRPLTRDDALAAFAKARPPQRVDQILIELRIYWKANPHLRLAQIIGNLYGGGDAYHYEDTDLLAALREKNR